jgi:hypothetical protein
MLSCYLGETRTDPETLVVVNSGMGNRAVGCALRALERLADDQLPTEYKHRHVTKAAPYRVSVLLNVVDLLSD